MSNTLVRVYDQLVSAENTRRALLDSGFRSENVRLVSNGDEAGPVQGNFVLEYKDAEHAGDRSVFDALLGRDDINEGLGRQAVAWRDHYLLTVDVQDDEQFRRAADIADRFSGAGSGTHRQ